jgi:hypothetical protein
VDGDSSVIPLLPALCYLYESAVTALRELTIPRIRVTKSAIDGLPARSKDTVYWDIGLPGFGVKVTPRGRKVFVVMYRLAGAGSRLRKYTIGPFGRLDWIFRAFSKQNDKRPDAETALTKDAQLAGVRAWTH